MKSSVIHDESKYFLKEAPWAHSHRSDISTVLQLFKNHFVAEIWQLSVILNMKSY